MIEYIALNCPKISAKIDGKVNKRLVFHSEVTRILGKEDCNLSEEILDKWEAELTVTTRRDATKVNTRRSDASRGPIGKKTARVEKKPVKVALEKDAPTQLELDLEST